MKTLCFKHNNSLDKNQANHKNVDQKKKKTIKFSLTVCMRRLHAIIDCDTIMLGNGVMS